MIISSRQIKDSRRQRQFDTVHQTAISALSYIPASADSEVVKRRIEAEIRKFEEVKAA